MIPLPQPDPTLPTVPLLFDGDMMGEILGRHALGHDGVAITSCRPTYVRYKPGTNCLVAYEVVLDTGNGMLTKYAHIRTFADDRGRRRMGERKLQKLTDRATADFGTSELGWVTYIPELNGIFSLFPVDYDLPPLVKLATAASSRKYLRRTLGDYRLVLTAEPTMVRYKPGRKALFRYDTDNGVIYGKLHAEDRGDAIRAATEALIAAGLRTPPVIGTNEKLRLIVHGEAPGVQLASLRHEARYPMLLASLAGPLTRLHRAPLDGLDVHRLGHEMDRLWKTTNLLGVILPRIKVRLETIIRVLGDRVARIDDELATNHGDFYDDQAIVDGDDIAIIDLDGIRLAHPMLDIGNMLAHLRAGEARGEVSPDAREAFIDGMRRYRAMDELDITTFEAIGLLNLAPESFRRLDPEWPETIDAMVELIEGVLDIARLPPVIPNRHISGAGMRVEDALRQPRDRGRHSEDASTGTSLCAPHGRDNDAWRERDFGFHTDEKLPELPALQDPARMQGILRNVTGNHGLVLERIHIQRHKPGRRAIIRYDIAGDTPVWGKIFASKRGPGVEEITRAICDAQAFGPEVALPYPIAFLPDLRVLLQRSVPGKPITAHLLAGNPALATQVADAIHAFHTSGLDLGRTHDLDRELSPLHDRVDDLRQLFPAPGDEAAVLYARLLEMSRTVQTWRFLPIHRDFYDAQVLIDGDRLSVLDLDDATMSEPSIDVANFAAHLALMALKHADQVEGIMRARECFLERSRELDPALDDRLLAFLSATTLLRLAGIHGLREDGERIAQRLLRYAGEIVATISIPESGSQAKRISA